MKFKKIGYTLFLVLGIVSVIIGYFLLEGKWSGLLIGLGSGIFGGSSAQLIGIQFQNVISHYKDVKGLSKTTNAMCKFVMLQKRRHLI